MPIDPNLAQAILNPPQFKQPDPIQQMGGALTNALMMDKIQTSRQERMDNAMMNEAWKAAGGDRTKVQTELVNRGHGAKVPGLMKQFAEIDDKQAGADKARAEALGKRLENTSKMLVLATNPQQMVDIITKDPDLGASLTERGMSPDQLLATLNQMPPEQFQSVLRQMQIGAKEALEQHYTLVGEAGKQTLVGSNKYGAPNAQVAGTYGPKPSDAASVTINNGGDKYSDRLAALQAEDDFKKGKRAEAAPLIISEVRRGLNLVDRAYTGKASPIQKGVNEWSNAFGVPVGSDDARVATQDLQMILSGDMLKNIGTLRNEYDVKLGSVTEKEFTVLQNTIPKITDDPVTIKNWLMRLEQATINAQQEYKTRRANLLNSPVTGPAVQGMSVPEPPQLPGMGTPPGPPQVPSSVVSPRTGKPIPQGAIDELKRSPGTAAMFDKTFGLPAGTAARLAQQGGSPNGARPFPGEAGAR